MDVPFALDVPLMVQGKTGMKLFVDAKDTTTILELKKKINYLISIPPDKQQLFNKENIVMEDDKTLQNYGLPSTKSIDRIGLAERDENGAFEQHELTPSSSPSRFT